MIKKKLLFFMKKNVFGCFESKIFNFRVYHLHVIKENAIFAPRKEQEFSS